MPLSERVLLNQAGPAGRRRQDLFDGFIEYGVEMRCDYTRLGIGAQSWAGQGNGPQVVSFFYFEQGPFGFVST